MQASQTVQKDGRNDFDFLIGNWKAKLRKLINPLTGSSEWVEYEGTSRIYKVWNGLANTEEFDVHNQAKDLHIIGQTLRLYNPVSKQWSIYLVDAQKGTLAMPPTVGGFKEGRGEFYDYEEWKGRWILVRYVWTNEGPNYARMEQAFSTDGGKSWEPNWICELRK